MSRIKLALVLALSSITGARAETANSVVTEHFLDTLKMIESSGGRKLVGDNGKSLGPYQISEAAWGDVSKRRKRRGAWYASWKESAMTEDASRSYAREHCQWLEARLKLSLGKPPTSAQVYSAYNCGLATICFIRGDLSRLGDVAHRNVMRFQDVQR